MSRPRTTQKEQVSQELTSPNGMPYTLTMQETSKILRCGINGCYEAARRGEIPTVRVGRRLLVPTVALMAMLGHDEAPQGVETGEGVE